MSGGRPTQDLTGLKFGMLTVIERDYTVSRRDSMWKCVCDCGKEKTVASHSLTHYKTKSCGCSKAKFVADSKLKDVAGKRFGRLIAIERVGYTNAHLSIWKCKCDCGNISNVALSGLMNGTTLSCGCLHRETFNGFKHGESKTKLYRVWCGMKERCSRPEHISYKYYGGKGISVCDEWNNNFMSFKVWSFNNGYADGLQIDRIDSDKDYCPENCRWITQKENVIKSVELRERNRKIENKVEI